MGEIQSPNYYRIKTMRKKILSLGIAFLLVGLVSAQEKEYSMKDAVIGLYTNLAPENLQQNDWIPNEDAFTKLKKDDGDSYLVKVSVPNMQEEKLFGLKEINAQLFGEDPLKSLPQIKFIQADQVYFQYGKTLYKGHLENGKWDFSKWVEFPKPTTNYFVDDQGTQVAFSMENDLWMLDAQQNIQKVTNEEFSEIVSGQVVSRNEFGIEKGAYFSPKGTYLAFYQKDETKVKDYPIIDWSVTPAVSKTIKYPMVGDSVSEIISLVVYNPKTQESMIMQTDKADDDYLTNVSWAPDEKSIFIGVFKRNQKQLTLNQYDIKTGEKIRTLFEEKDDKYVHPADPLFFIPGKEDEFLWTAERDGFMHLYRYNTKGKLLNQVTKGDWLVNGVEGWNTAKNEVIISATKESPLNKNIYAVNWKNGKMRKLDDADGMHSAKVSKDGQYWLDRYSNYTTPNHIAVKAINKNWSRELVNAENPLKDYAQPSVKHFTLKAADGETDLYAKMILPPDFDESKKYPVIVYLYNGPGIQLLHNSFPESGNLWYDYMAQHGYIVFTMDGRGSSNRGMDFEQVTHRHLGTVEMEDQLKGVEYLKSLPYVDGDRLGVHGWSFGGFMTTSLMLRHPGVFKVGVAGGPVIDWRMYEIMYTERFMDRPENNLEGYDTASLLDKTENLEGRLLLIHGAQDDVVVWQHSMKLLRESVKNNKQFDYYVYPAHPHNVMGADRIHLMQKITNYFDDFLK